MVVSLWYSATHSSPLFDEPAHFASGVILAYHGDAGTFRVNPPANKWVTAVAMLFTREMHLPTVVSSVHSDNRIRQEFEIGDSVIQLNRDEYMDFLQWARYARIPIMLIGSWLLLIATESFFPSRRLLCQVLWCTSPLLLGHGWVVSADAMAAVAMCLVLVTTIALWKSQSLARFAISGFAWGLAIGTKFTFGPLYLLYLPVFHFCLPRNLNTAGATPPSRSWVRFAGNWALHAMVALLTLDALYCFDGIGVPLVEHNFTSRTFRKLLPSAQDAGWASIPKILAHTPSLLPKVFLEGVDQQLADMDYPRGAYWMGKRIPGEINWFHVFGYFVKEQVAVWFGIAIAFVAMLTTMFRSRKEHPIERTFCVDFCLLYIICFGGFMTTQSNLVWNVRYLTPVLPLIYVLLAGAIPTVSIRLKPQATGLADFLPYGLAFLAMMEFSLCFPHFFSYTNPFVGGSHRVPMALNDSNFDYGQDLFFVRRWLESQHRLGESKSELQVHGLLSGHGRIWMTDFTEPASQETVLQAIRSRRKALSSDRPTNQNLNNSQKKQKKAIVILSRGLFAPEPWARKYTQQAPEISFPKQESICELLIMPPDVHITPVVVGYWIDKDE